MVVAELPPDTDQIGKTIDKIAFREALLGLLDVALPVMRVDVLVCIYAAGIPGLCRMRADRLAKVGGGHAPLHLQIHDLSKTARLAPGATIIVIGGGEATMGLRLTSLVSKGVIPVGSTGGAALAIWEETYGLGPAVGSYAEDLRDDPVYDALFRDLLRRAYPETMAEKAAAPAVTDAR